MIDLIILLAAPYLVIGLILFQEGVTASDFFRLSYKEQVLVFVLVVFLWLLFGVALGLFPEHFEPDDSDTTNDDDIDQNHCRNCGEEIDGGWHPDITCSKECLAQLEYREAVADEVENRV